MFSSGCRSRRRVVPGNTYGEAIPRITRCKGTWMVGLREVVDVGLFPVVPASKISKGNIVRCVWGRRSDGGEAGWMGRTERERRGDARRKACHCHPSTSGLKSLQSRDRVM